MIRNISIIVFIMVALKGYGQLERDVFSFNYTLAPIGNDAVDFYKTDFKINISFKLKKGVLINSVGYDYYQLSYTNAPMNTEELNSFHGVNYRLTYLYPRNNKWNLSAGAGVSISSNLASSITHEDFLFNGGITAIKKGGTYKNPSLFVFGLGYSTLAGKPSVLPLISYSRKVNNTFSYGIGFPNTYATYNLTDRSSFNASLWQNGHYANLSNPVAVTMMDEANKASYTAISLGLDYAYQMDDT
ncbi:DUF6268 family outer membrane beta-barrel protein [Psychroflexus sp. MES1-P1E]|uniref:DUF6268 family outer membrane beta-barrel protein n=1 Tax=Psychroflexus sp. MES1-P1E TaxID=2058320 RepID=UPI000C7DE082|nr:DUF6268 family outer membrane beta-barrel protein [Psychroflexus sp. MES1-P1E]PKG43764.1 hypothetical protein CXF67_03235 [Psychroflexus sp. MES1-P1E]